MREKPHSGGMGAGGEAGMEVGMVVVAVEEDAVAVGGVVVEWKWGWLWWQWERIWWQSEG